MGELRASRPALVVALVVLFGVGILLGAAGVPTVVVAFSASVVGVGLVTGHLSARREAASARRMPDAAEGLPVRIHATRVGFDTKWYHLKFLSPSREVVSPGMLWVGPGRIVFVPSRPSHEERAWSADVSSAELVRVFGRECMLRLRDVVEPAQFVLAATPEEVRSAVAPFVEVSEITERV